MSLHGTVRCRLAAGKGHRLTPLIRIRYVCFLALCCFVSPAHAQWISDSAGEAHIQRGIRYVYNLAFDSARADFQSVTAAHPDDPAGYFFLAMVDWWKIVTDLDNTSNDERFLGLLDKVVDLCDKRLDKDDKDVKALFFKGGAVGFQGRLHGNRGDWIKAANAGRIALPLVQKMYELAPENYDILLGIGIYNYYAAVIPDLYPFVKPLMIFFPKGDRTKGIEQLRLASRKATYANFEATYFLLQALNNFEKKPLDALPLAIELHSTFPDNVIFHKYVGRCYASLGNWAEMRKVFTDVLRRFEEKRTGYDTSAAREANYYLGLEEMNAGRYDTALHYFYRSDEQSRTLDRAELSGFMVLTNLRIGMIYDLQGKRDLATEQYNKVLKMNDYQDAHKQAEEYLKSPYRKS